MKPHVLPLLLVALILYSSCSHGNSTVSRSLDRIESLVEEHSDSALLELVRLDSLIESGTVRIEGERQQARYALLKTQTNDKNYIDDTSDSLIQTAVRYYDEHGDEHERMLAYFYLGAIHRNARDLGAAFVAYRHAEALALELGNDHYLSLIYGNLSTLSRESYSGDAVEYSWKNLQYARRSGDRREALQAMADLAMTYSVRMEYDSAELYYRQVLDSLPSSDPIVQSCLTSCVEQCINTGRFHFADSLLGMLYQSTQPVDLLNKACLFQMKGVEDSAKFYVSKAKQYIETPEQQVFLFEKLSWITEMQGDYPVALDYKNKRIRAQNKVVTSVFSKSVSDYQCDFEQQQKQHAQFRYAQYRKISLLVAAFAIFLACLGILYYFRRKVEYQRAIDNYMENISVLNQTLIERTQANNEEMQKIQMEANDRVRHLQAEMNQQIIDIQSKEARMQDEVKRVVEHEKEREQMFQSRVLNLFNLSFQHLNALCVSYFDNQGKIGAKQQIYEKVLDIIRSFSSSEAQEKLDKLIDTTFDNAMQKAKSPEMNLSEAELLLLRYKIAGLSSRAIRLLLQIDSREVLKKRQQRLRAKILASSSPFRDEIAALIP